MIVLFGFMLDIRNEGPYLSFTRIWWELFKEGQAEAHASLNNLGP